MRQMLSVCTLFPAGAAPLLGKGLLPARHCCGWTSHKILLLVHQAHLGASGCSIPVNVFRAVERRTEKLRAAAELYATGDWGSKSRITNLFGQVILGMWVLTLHKDALEFLLIIFKGKSPSGHLGSAPCPAPWFSLLITTSGAAETMLFSPGLAGGMWVSAVMSWKSVPAGRHWAWHVEQELSCQADVFWRCWHSWSQLQGGNTEAGCDYQESVGVFCLLYYIFFLSSLFTLLFF